MRRILALLAIVAVCSLPLAGCGGSKTADEAGSTPTKSTAEPVIADKRIIGKWKGTDGSVEFLESGTALLDDGTKVPFKLPSSTKLEMQLAGGTAVYEIDWVSDDRHGAKLVGGKEDKFTFYDRVK